MSYSFEDYFEDKIVPEMNKLFNNYSQEKENKKINEPYISDMFLSILKVGTEHYIRGEDFSKRLLRVAIKDHEDLTPEEFIKKCFYLYYGDMTLRKIEYVAKDDSLVNINYNGIQEEEALLEKIAEIKAKNM